jgi:hypothetical protein
MLRAGSRPFDYAQGKQLKVESGRAERIYTEGAESAEDTDKRGR